MNLLKTITAGVPADKDSTHLVEYVDQSALKKSDASDAGSQDVVNKTDAGDIKFSLMRNTINADGKVTGSDVNNYLERAAELNNEVDSVVYGLETDDGQIVKVYINAQQADAFEAELKKMLGMEDDIEEVVNDLASRFDIVDVVWPKGTEQSGGPGNPEDKPEDLDLGDSTEDDQDDDMEVVASADDTVTDDATDDDATDDDATDDDATDDDATDDDAAPEKTDDKKDKHSKLSGIGKKLKGVSEDQQTADQANLNEVKMTIGNKFLQRVLAEDKKLNELNDVVRKDMDGFRDEFDIPGLSASSPVLTNIPFPLARVIIQMYQLFGMSAETLEARPGAVRNGAVEFADEIRTNSSLKKAVFRLHAALAEELGYTRKLAEKKAMPSLAQDELTLQGSKTMAQMEELLLRMGLPAMIVKRGIRNDRARMMDVALLLQKGVARTRLNALAQELGVDLQSIKSGDKTTVSEAIDPAGADTYADAVMELVSVLGVPDSAFARNARNILSKEFRDARRSVNLGALTGRVKTFTAQFSKLKSQASREE